MMSLVSIDPGLRGCGFAVFDAGTLRRAGYITKPGRSRGVRWH